MSNWLDLKLEGTKPVCEVGALKFCIEELERENAELKAQLVEVSNNRTGVSPCAKFCEALAAKKMFDNLLQQNTSLLNLLTDIRQACGDNGKRMQDELVQYIAELYAKATERDPLKAQVEQLRVALVKIWDSSNFEQEQKAITDSRLVIDATPSQHLAEIKAQAGRDGYEAGWDDAIRCIDKDPVIYSNSDDYADKIRQQAKGE